jgi:hypothetical protein
VNSDKTNQKKEGVLVGSALRFIQDKPFQEIKGLFPILKYYETTRQNGKN